MVLQVYAEIVKYEKRAMRLKNNALETKEAWTNQVEKQRIVSISQTRYSHGEKKDTHYYPQVLMREAVVLRTFGPLSRFRFEQGHISFKFVVHLSFHPSQFSVSSL